MMGTLFILNCLAFVGTAGFFYGFIGTLYHKPVPEWTKEPGLAWALAWLLAWHVVVK